MIEYIVHRALRNLKASKPDSHERFYWQGYYDGARAQSKVYDDDPNRRTAEMIVYQHGLKRVFKCSKCGVVVKPMSNYCPMCGAHFLAFGEEDER